MSDDRGQISPLIAVLVALTAGAMILVATLGGRSADVARAEAAAEAAALAAAAENDPAAATRLAGANGATVVSVEMGPPVVVTVRLGEVEATAAADAVAADPVP